MIMSFLNLLARADVFLVGSATAIILFAIVTTAVVQGANTTEKSFSQIITVGPVWNTNSWICTSDAQYMVHAVLVAYEPNSRIEIFLSGNGLQPDFAIQPREMKTFSIGGEAGTSLRITGYQGQVTGFITLQTEPDATASCERV